MFYLQLHEYNRRYVFYLGGGGVGGASVGGSLVNSLQIGEGQTCFLHNRGKDTGLFLARKNYSISVS